MMQLCIKMQFLSVFPDIKKLLFAGEEILMPAELKCYVIYFLDLF